MMRAWRTVFFSMAGLGILHTPNVLSQSTVPAQPASASTAALSPAPTVVQHQSFQLMQMVDQLSPYRPTEKLKGKAILTGSTTMNDLGHQWALNFKQFHPEVEFSGLVDGSEAALKLLASDPTVIAGVSRPVDVQDQKMLQAGKCKSPVAITVAIDALAIYVHKNNPIASITPETVKKIFAAGPDGNAQAKVWGDLGVQGPLAKEPISVYERNEGSGFRVYLSKALLGGASLANNIKPCNSNTEICKSIGGDPRGVGFAEISFEDPNTRRVPLLVQGQLVSADEANVLAGKYPITRPLMLVIDKDQLSHDGKLRESILRYVLSRDGQAIVMKSGFYPLSPNFIRQQLDEIVGKQLR